MDELAYLQLSSSFRFSLTELLFSLVHALTVTPLSKSRTFLDALPLMEGASVRLSLGQLYDSPVYLGKEYEKVVEIYGAWVAGLFGRDVSVADFDCTNF